MDEFATKFADLLDDKVIKPVRTLTDDRVNRILVLTVLGLVSTMLLLLALIFLTIAFFRALGTWVTVEGAYAIVGGLFIVSGAFVWSKRLPKSAKNSKDPTNA